MTKLSMNKVTNIPTSLKPNGEGIAVTSARFIADEGAVDASTVDETLRRLERSTEVYKAPEGKQATQFAVGHLAAGTSVEDLNGKPLSEILNLMLYGTLYPVITQPSVEIYWGSEDDPKTTGDTITSKETMPEVHYIYHKGTSTLNGITTDYSGEIAENGVKWVWKKNNVILTTPPTHGEDGATFTVQLQLTINDGTYLPHNSDGGDTDASGLKYTICKGTTLTAELTFSSTFVGMIWMGDDATIPSSTTAFNVAAYRELTGPDDYTTKRIGSVDCTALLISPKTASDHYNITDKNAVGYASNSRNVPMHILLPSAFTFTGIGLMSSSEPEVDARSLEELQRKDKIKITKDVEYNNGSYTQYDITGFTYGSTYVLVNLKQ